MRGPRVAAAAFAPRPAHGRRSDCSRTRRFPAPVPAGPVSSPRTHAKSAVGCSQSFSSHSRNTANGFPTPDLPKPLPCAPADSHKTWNRFPRRSWRERTCANSRPVGCPTRRMALPMPDCSNPVRRGESSRVQSSCYVSHAACGTWVKQRSRCSQCLRNWDTRYTSSRICTQPARPRRYFKQIPRGHSCSRSCWLLCSILSPLPPPGHPP